MAEGTRGSRPELEALLARMSLAEKIGQLTMVAADYAVTGPNLSPGYRSLIASGEAGSVLNLWGAEAVAACQRAARDETRLGIPLLIGFDVIHGHRTIFPVPLAEAGAFDPDLWRRTAAAAAEEAAADGIALTFAPMLDIARDLRWGRVVETAGEDPYVSAQFAIAKTRGFQGDSLTDPRHVAATAKHFVGYGAVAGGREYASVDMSERALYEIHLPPFRAALDAGIAAIMPAFNDLAGRPMTAHRPLLRGLLRDRWGFKGVIISDYAAIHELIAHGVAGDRAEAAALALSAGVDIDMMGDCYRLGLLEALARGLIEHDLIDQAVMRVLRLKAALGLFEDPDARGRMPVSEQRREAIRTLARDAAVQSFVLLRNDGEILPLNPAVRKIALLGPLSDCSAEMPGPWGAAADRGASVSYLDGLRAGLPQVEILVDEGEADAADVVVLCLGETAAMSGEAASRSDPSLPADQIALAERILALGKPVVVILETGRPLTLGGLESRVSALLVVWHPGSAAGAALAQVLSGEAEPGGRLAMSWPVTVGQSPVQFAQRPTGRPADAKTFYSSKYSDVAIAPRFPFGAGQGYGRVAWRDFRLSPEVADEDAVLTLEIDLENIGSRPTVETVFLFSRDPIASVARPLRELRRFARVPLALNERRTLVIQFPIRELAFPDSENFWESTLEMGQFFLFAGPSADPDTQLSATVSLELVKIRKNGQNPPQKRNI